MAQTLPVRFASQANGQRNEGGGWADFGPSLDFTPSEAGVYLVTINIAGISTQTGEPGAGQIRVIWTGGLSPDQPETMTFVAPPANSPVPVSYQCLAKVAPPPDGVSRLTGQWQATAQGLSISEGILCTLSAVGSLQPAKVLYDDRCHLELPDLFSRGLRLTNFSETLFISGYSASPPDKPDPSCTESFPLNMTPSEQMQWIVRHLDRYFATIPYADGTGHYSKYDVVYFDLCIDQTVDDTEQEAVLDVLRNWFADVDPKPSTGILKKVEALANPLIKVEIEFIMAH